MSKDLILKDSINNSILGAREGLVLNVVPRMQPARLRRRLANSGAPFNSCAATSTGTALSHASRCNSHRS